MSAGAPGDMSTPPTRDPIHSNHDNTTDSLVPVIIILVCGIIFVLVCFIISLVFFRKHEPRMRRPPRDSGEPELLSYCSTVDSYRNRLIWDFEGSRQVQDFISRVISNTLSLSTDLSRSVTSQEARLQHVTSQEEGLSQKILRQVTSDQNSRDQLSASPVHSPERLCPKHRTLASFSRGNTPDILIVPTERRLGHTGQYLAAERWQPLVGTQSPTHAHGGTLMCNCGCNFSSGDNFRGSDASFWETKEGLDNDRYHDSAEQGSYHEALHRETKPALTELNSNKLQARVSSLPCFLTDSESHYISESEFPNSWQSSRTSQSSSGTTLSQSMPGLCHMTVLSQSELSVNIRSCPDSPLCGAAVCRDDATKAVDSRAGLPHALSTTILDLVHSAARKQGLTRDSIVREVTN